MDESKISGWDQVWHYIINNNELYEDYLRTAGIRASMFLNGINFDEVFTGRYLLNTPCVCHVAVKDREGKESYHVLKREGLPTNGLLRYMLNDLVDYRGGE